MTQSAATLDSRSSIKDLKSDSKESQDRAFQSLSAMTKDPVDWAYEAWDDLIQLLQEGDNKQRAIAAQILCNLAQSDPEERLVRDFDTLLAVTRDERFVTARHCLLSLWKVAIAGPRQYQAVVEGLTLRFKECADEKNGTLIRYDIQCTLKRIFDHQPDPALQSTADQLIQLEADPKYKKKYSTVWRTTKA